MVNRAYILLFALCIQFDPSLQQLQKLRKRLNYIEAMITSVTLKNIKTQFDISELRDAIELLNNKTEGESSVHTCADVSPLDAAAIADLESEMKKAINQHDLTITAIAKAVSDEKKYTRQQMEALEIVAESIANQSIDEIKSDVMDMNSKLKEEIQHEVKSHVTETKEMNSKLKEDVQEVKSELMETKEMNSKLKKEVEENKKEILELRHMIMEMKQTKHERGYSSVVPVPVHLPSAAALPSTVVPVPTHMPSAAALPSTAVPVPTHLPSTAVPVPVRRLRCQFGWRKFQDTCYLRATNEHATWDVAKTRCTGRGGKLAEPDTEEKMRYVLKTFLGFPWIGGTDRQSEGTWVWSSSKKNIKTFFLWWPGQPDNSGGDQDCMYIYNGALYDLECLYELPFICEKKANI